MLSGKWEVVGEVRLTNDPSPPPLHAARRSSPKCRQAFFFTTRVSEFFTAAARRILHRERQRTSLRRRSLRSYSVTSPPPLKLWRDKPAARRRRISPERQRRFRRFVRTDFTLPTARFRPTKPKQRRGATLTQRRRSLRSFGVTSRRSLCSAYFLRRRAASPARASRLSVAVVGSGMFCMRIIRPLAVWL